MSRTEDRNADSGDDRNPDDRGGRDDPSGHDAGDDHGTDDPSTHDVGDDHGVDDPRTHDVGDDHGADDPTTHDVGDDHGTDDPTTHDVGDDHGSGGHGTDDPADHDAQDDRGGAQTLTVVQNARTGQWLFTDDGAEARAWLDDHGRQGDRIELPAPAAEDRLVSVWRFHDPGSDVYFWTSDDGLRAELQHHHPELEFQGEAFRAYADDHGGRHQAIGVVWDRDAGGPYGSFTYAPVDEAVNLVGQGAYDGLTYLGIAFWI